MWIAKKVVMKKLESWQVKLTATAKEDYRMFNWIAFPMQETHQDAISSSANSTPPTGARKPAAIPAADPHVTRSRRSRSFLKKWSHLHVNLNLLDPPWPSNAATHAPVCTIGPAFPTKRDEETADMLPIICKMNKNTWDFLLPCKQQTALKFKQRTSTRNQISQIAHPNGIHSQSMQVIEPKLFKTIENKRKKRKETFQIPP